MICKIFTKSIYTNLITTFTPKSHYAKAFWINRKRGFLNKSRTNTCITWRPFVVATFSFKNYITEINTPIKDTSFSISRIYNETLLNLSLIFIFPIVNGFVISFNRHLSRRTDIAEKLLLHLHQTEQWMSDNRHRKHTRIRSTVNKTDLARARFALFNHHSNTQVASRDF